MNGTQEQEFRTADMALAAYLILEGFGYESVEARDGNGRVTAEFVFSESGELSAAAHEYELGQVVVEPRDFTRKVAFVRNRMKDCVRDFRSAPR